MPANSAMAYLGNQFFLHILCTTLPVLLIPSHPPNRSRFPAQSSLLSFSHSETTGHLHSFATPLFLDVFTAWLPCSSWSSWQLGYPALSGRLHSFASPLFLVVFTAWLPCSFWSSTQLCCPALSGRLHSLATLLFWSSSQLCCPALSGRLHSLATLLFLVVLTAWLPCSSWSS